VQVVLEQRFEVAWRVERVKCGLQRPFGLVVEPFVDKLVEILLLLQPLHQFLFVVETHRRRRHLAVHEQIRLAIAAEAFDRLLEFVLGAGFVTGPVSAREVLWQLRPEPRPKNGDDDIRVRRLDYLVLKRRRRDQRLVLPQDRLEHQSPDVLTLQPVDDPIRDCTLFVDVAGRGDK
jgi:hypothetical protein